MACTYEYSTGKITLDFHLVRDGEKCRRMGLPAKVGNDYCSRCCPFNGGGFMDHEAALEDTFWTKCKHEQAKNSEGSENALYKIRKAFRDEALCHFYD